jgi:PAS domain S-box-containing protein
MPQNFLACDREQELLLPPSLREWLPESHLAWCVIDAVGEFDLAAFYRAYRADGWGRAAHEPAMMVALLLYAYAAGGDWSMSFVSERIREICGYAATGLMRGAPSYMSIVAAAERQRVAACIAALDPDGDGYLTIDYEIQHADGQPRWVREMAHVVRDRDGTIRWLDGTISDITQIKRLEEDGERLEAELRLSQRLEAVGQLAAGVAHEINTPIQFVGDSLHFLENSYGDLQRLLDEYRALLDEISDDPAHRQRIEQAEEAADLAYLRERLPAALERTKNGVDRVATIVLAMKDFGRPSQVEHAPADLNEALRSTLIVSSNEYKYVADVETSFDDLPRVVCNINELNQVFLNLIVNAAHAIGDAAHDGRRGTIRIRTASALDHVVVTISDDGPGIPDDIRPRVFDPFFTTKDVGRGTGQGLAISRSIVVDKHAGSLSVDSQPGDGAKFTVRLPLERHARESG